MKDENFCRFKGVMYALPERLSNILLKLPIFLKNSACEIRLRKNGPLCITAGKTFYISEDAVASTRLPFNPLIVTEADLKEVILRITDHSVYRRTDELRQGYLSMRMGCRAGVCGSFSSSGTVTVSSVNIRIAREIKGCADKLLPYCKGGLLIAGPPGSGKTTLLRDLVRQLSNRGERVCVVDTRGEICGDQSGGKTLDVGVNTDIITGLKKAEGAEIALRTMFPQYIFFDEVSSSEELRLIKESFFAGVTIITTAHARTAEDLRKRAVITELMGGPIENLVLLDAEPGKEFSILSQFMEKGAKSLA